MNITLFIALLFVFAFAISMFVAGLIWLLYNGMSSHTFHKLFQRKS